MWRDAGRVLSAEWFKRRRSRALYLGPAVYVAVLVVLYVGYEISARRGVIGISSGFFVAGSVLSAATLPLAFVAVLIASYSIAREFSSGTIQLTWPRPLTRRDWLLGKAVAVGTELSAFFVITLAVILLMAGTRLGFHALVEKDYIVHASSALWGRLVLTSALTLVALLAVTIVAAIPAVAIGTPGGALTTLIVAGFLMEIAGGWDLLQPYLLTTYVSQPFDQFVAMAKGLPVPWEWKVLVRTCLAGSLAWALAAWLLAVGLIRRKNIFG